MTHINESPTAVARGRAQGICQPGKPTATQILVRLEAINSTAALVRSDSISYAAHFLSRRYGLSARRAALIVELAGLAAAP